MDRGLLLERWIDDVVRLPRSIIARRLRVGRSTLSNWIRDPERFPKNVGSLDAALGAEGVFESLCWACTTSSSSPPRRSWDHSFEDDVLAPVWAWVRPAVAGRCTVDFRLGVLALRSEFDASLEGCFVTSPVGVRNPPIRVTMDPPGWVDFGVGRVPSELGIPVVAATQATGLTVSPDIWVSIFGGHIRRVIGDVRIASVASDNRLTVPLAQVAKRMLESDSPVAASTQVTASALGDLRSTPGQEFANVRKSRSLSQRQLADKIGLGVTRSSIDRFERKDNLPRNFELLPAAIDHALECRGRLGQVTLAANLSGTAEVTIPPWWRGAPVWVQVSSPARVRLRWSWYRRDITLAAAGAALVTHFGGPPFILQVECDNESSFSVGLGHRPGALDVTDDWTFASLMDLARVVRWSLSVIPHLLGTVRADSAGPVQRAVSDVKRRSRVHGTTL